MTQEQALSIFEESGALLTGHFVLTSGRHSDRYFEKFHVLRHPQHVEALCKALAEKLAPTKPDVVLGPTTLGVLLAYEVAKFLGVPAAYGEKGPDNQRFLRRPEHLPAGARVAVVDDILTTGGSIRECVDLIGRQEAELVSVGVLVDRSGGALDFGVPLESPLSLNVQSWEESELPDWLAETPITRPGSTGKK
ncbi:MAG: orotate phosphoribosyltransferase [Armatimonas sp.]